MAPLNRPHRMLPRAHRLTPWALAIALLLPAGLAMSQDPPPAAGPVTAPLRVIDSLPAAIARAIEVDPQVRSAKALAAASQARVSQARSRWYPTATVQANTGRSQDLEGNNKVGRRTSQIDTGMRWNVYNGGNDSREVEAAEKELAATQEDLRRTRQEVAERVVESYMELSRQDRLHRLAVDSRDQVVRLTERVEEQLRQGKASEADRLQAMTSLLNAEAAINDARNSRAAEQNKLEVLLGQPVSRITPYAPPPLVSDVADSEAVFANPTVRAAQARAAAARARVGTVAEAVMPKVDLTTRKTLSNNTSPAYSSTPQNSWSLGVAWEMPLGGEPLHRQEDASQRAIAAEEDANRIAQLIRAELMSLPSRAGGSQEQIRMLNEQIGHSQRLIRAAMAQYEAGRRSVQQLIQTREVQHDLDQRLLNERHRLAMIQLRRLSLRGELISTMAQGNQVAPEETPAAPLIDPMPAVTPSSKAIFVPMPELAAVQGGEVTATAVATPRAPSATPIRSGTAGKAAATEATQDAAPTTTAPPEAAQSLNEWLRAWAAKDADRYLEFYAPDFEPDGGMSLAKWREQRRSRLNKPGAISVQASNLRWHMSDARTAVAHFVQSYRSADFSDTMRKQVVLRDVGSRWLIVREQAE